VASVYLTAGTFDVVAPVMAPGMSALSELLLERRSATPGISGVRSNIVTNWYSEVHWRLGAISTGQELAVHPDDAARDQASERCWRTWQPVLGPLTAHHEVLAPALAGHSGGPELPPGPGPTVSGCSSRLACSERASQWNS